MHGGADEWVDGGEESGGYHNLGSGEIVEVTSTRLHLLITLYSISPIGYFRKY